VHAPAGSIQKFPSLLRHIYEIHFLLLDF